MKPLNRGAAKVEERPAAAKSQAVPPSRVGMRAVTTRLSPEALKQLKMDAVERSMSLEGIMREAVNDYFEKRHKPPVA
jgi:hypothetical protein